MEDKNKLLRSDNDNSVQSENPIAADDEMFEKYVDGGEADSVRQEGATDVIYTDSGEKDNTFEKDDLHSACHEKSEGENRKKIFKKFKVKDIVFLAIMSAVVLVTSSVMPLVIPLQSTVFGIAQLVTGLQLSIFPAIALSKVRKTGSMFFMSVFTGVIQLLMSPAMFVNNIVIGLLLEAAVAIIFRGYDKDAAVFFAVALYNPLSLPFNYVYNLIIGNEVMTAVADKAPWAAVGMSFAVVAVSVIGTLIGMRISKELKKAGVLKK